MRRRLTAVTMADIHPIKTPAETALAEAFERAARRLPGTDAIASCATRLSSVSSSAGLPHRRVEDWKYTDLRSLMREARPLAPAPDERARQGRAPSEVLRDHAHLRLTLVDGTFAPSLSDVGLLPAGVRVVALPRRWPRGSDRSSERLGLLAPDNAALALNAAFMTDGIVLAVEPGVDVRLPVLLQRPYRRARAQATYTALLVVLGRGRLDDPRRYAMRGRTARRIQTNAAHRGRISATGAGSSRVSVQAESARALHLSTLVASLGARRRLSTLHAWLAARRVARNQLFVTLRGRGAHARAQRRDDARRHGAMPIRRSSSTMPCRGGESRELFQAVLDGEARRASSKARSSCSPRRRRPTAG